MLCGEEGGDVVRREGTLCMSEGGETLCAGM